jgi:hypothetical protein
MRIICFVVERQVRFKKCGQDKQNPRIDQTLQYAKYCLLTCFFFYLQIKPPPIQYPFVADVLIKMEQSMVKITFILPSLVYVFLMFLFL